MEPLITAFGFGGNVVVPFGGIGAAVVVPFGGIGAAVVVPFGGIGVVDVSPAAVVFAVGEVVTSMVVVTAVELSESDRGAPSWILSN
mmetsp:Transcript_24852/g.57519  ORF Transcript_24852/g.57519 Transcript_24852/m.57519 type:complete len:87 (-) Transcript_24852:140-400(-)